MFLTSLLYAVLAVVTAGCQQQKDMQEQVIEILEEKYKEQNRNAEFVTVDDVPVAQKVKFVEPEEELLPDTANLRQIALIRHGEPDLLKNGQFSYEQAKDYIKNYDSVGIMVPDEPFFILEDTEDVVLFTSTIPRAQATAKYLFGADRDIKVSADFREFERKIGNRRMKMNLPLRYWTTTARIKWMLGIDREGIESFSEARERARRAAQILAEASEQNPKVVLVAHGFLNRYIKKNLEKMGWKVVRDGGSNYFATTILAKIEEDNRENKPLITDSDQ